MRQSGPSSRVRPARSFSRSPEAALVAVLAIGASIRGIFNDFVYDDSPIIQDNVRVHQFDFAHVRAIFSSAYWPPPFVEQLYRPLTLVGLAAQYAMGAGSPMVFRLVSYVLYAVTAVLVYRLATRVLDPWPSLGIAALFAVHPVHVEAVALGVNQAELLVGLIALVMTISYVDWRRAGAIRRRSWALLATLYALATLVKESGFMLPLFLVAAEVTILRSDESRWPRRVDVFGYALLAAVAAASLALRFGVAGSSAFAVVPAAELRGLDVFGRLGVMLHVVPMWLRLLAWPRHLQVDFAPGEIVSGGSIEAVFGFAFFAALSPPSCTDCDATASSRLRYCGWRSRCFLCRTSCRPGSCSASAHCSCRASDSCWLLAQSRNGRSRSLRCRRSGDDSRWAVRSRCSSFWDSCGASVGRRSGTPNTSE